MPFCSVPSFGLDQLLGFTSFLLDEEDEIWVAYCFELHVADNQQRKGFGQLLLKDPKLFDALRVIFSQYADRFLGSVNARPTAHAVTPQ